MQANRSPPPTLLDGVSPLSTKDVYDLLPSLCTVAQVQDLLREYKEALPKSEKKRILISGNEGAVIDQLRRAVKEKLIPPQKVFDLLQRSEENGNQHIFYFKARNKTVSDAIRKGEDVAVGIFGEEWADTNGFPKVDLVPELTTWADFRTDLKIGKPRDWLGKLYRMERHERFVKVDKTKGDFIHKIFKIELERNIIIIRWNDPDVLEIRLDRSENKSSKAMLARISEVWKLCEGPLKESDFVPWNVSRIATKLLANCAEHPKKEFAFVPGDISLSNPDGGGADMFAPQDGANLFTADERREMVKRFVASNAVCRQSTMTWTADKSNGQLEEDLVVFVGGLRPNEVVFRRRTASKEIDYVTNQFRSA